MPTECVHYTVTARYQIQLHKMTRKSRSQTRIRKRTSAIRYIRISPIQLEIVETVSVRSKPYDFAASV